MFIIAIFSENRGTRREVVGSNGGLVATLYCCNGAGGQGGKAAGWRGGEAARLHGCMAVE